MRAFRLAKALGSAGLALLLGCGRADTPPPAEAKVPMELPVDVLADTGRSLVLRIAPPESALAPPRAMVWLAQVTPSRSELLAAPPPATDSTIRGEAWPSPPALEVDTRLRPPLPQAAGTLRVAPGAGRASVELDVRVAEDGSVAEALWAGGSADTALVRAAVDCALQMRFHPALRAGRPVTVWCRQRFDFGAGGASANRRALR